MFLASAGYQVDVLERRGHPADMEVDKKRTYLIGLGEAAAAAELSCKEACACTVLLPVLAHSHRLEPRLLLLYCGR